MAHPDTVTEKIAQARAEIRDMPSDARAVALIEAIDRWAYTRALYEVESEEYEEISRFCFALRDSLRVLIGSRP